MCEFDSQFYNKQSWKQVEHIQHQLLFILLYYIENMTLNYG
jgi:hypothetical protein